MTNDVNNDGGKSQQRRANRLVPPQAQKRAEKVVGTNATQARAEDFARRLAGSKPIDAQDQQRPHGRRRLTDDQL